MIIHITIQWSISAFSCWLVVISTILSIYRNTVLMTTGKVSFQYLIILAETDINDQDNQTYFIRLKKKYDYCNIVSLFKHYSYSLAHDASNSNQRKMMSKVKKLRYLYSYLWIDLHVILRNICNWRIYMNKNESIDTNINGIYFKNEAIYTWTLLVTKYRAKSCNCKLDFDYKFKCMQVLAFTPSKTTCIYQVNETEKSYIRSTLIQTRFL